MSLRDRQRADRDQRIRAAARHLFDERGYDATTIRAIAERADVGVGTVLAYTDTKEALLHEVWRADALPVVEAATAQVPAGALADRWMAVFRPLLEHYAERPRLEIGRASCRERV